MRSPWFCHILIVALSLLSLNSTQAQVTAAFDADSVIGCDVLEVNFTDLSTGPVSSWSWVIYDPLGTPIGSSPLEDPSFIFDIPGVYDVELTVCDAGGSCDIIFAADYITLFESPEVLFDASSLSGCPPLPVTFDDITTYSSSSFVSRFWVIEGAPLLPGTPAISYTFNTPGVFDVTLIIEDNNGCSAFYEDSVEIFTPPVVSISSSDSSSCTAPFNVNFASSAAGVPPLSYSWDFGDGGSSSLPNPSHSYTATGSFTVSLTITDGNGCQSTETVPSMIQVFPANVDFDPDGGTFCTGTDIVFDNTSLPSTGSWSWDFGDGGSSGVFEPDYAYASPGVYTVALDGVFGSGCTGTHTGTLNLVDPPSIDFISPVTIDCKVPSSFTFTALTGATIVSYDWDFGDGSTGTGPNPTHTYTSFGIYDVSLTVTDINGCQSTEIKPAYIQVQTLDLTIVTDPEEGCVPLIVSFEDTTFSGPDPIISWLWDFGDGTGASVVAPNHVYTSPGCYDVILSVNTASGCTATQPFINEVCVGDTNTALFVVPDTSCPALPIEVLFPGLDAIDVYVDGILHETISNPDSLDFATGLPTGDINLELVSIHYGCPDTFQANIHILEPIDSIVTMIRDCDNPYIVTFILDPMVADSSCGWDWDMGDGTIISNVDTVVYTYATTGFYPVQLEVYCVDLGVCDELSTGGIWILDPVADFSPDVDNSCEIPYRIQFSNFSTDGLDDNLNYYWDFGDGGFSLVTAPGRNYTSYGMFEVTLIITDLNGCTDTHMDTVYLSNVEAGLEWDWLCSNLDIEFTDTTTSIGAISSWEIFFGDGTSTIITPPDSLGTLIHTYPFENEFDVSLYVINEFGCEDSFFVEVENVFLQAAFAVSDSTPCAGDTISFINNSIGDALTYFWDFGEPSTTLDTSSAANPSWSYGATGNYSPSLLVTDANGCTDTLEQFGLIQVDSMTIDTFSFTTLVSSCNFSLVEFHPSPADTAMACEYLWQFGDGGISIERDPIYPYLLAGNYNVTLTITNCNGCVASMTLDNAITVEGPWGAFEFSDDSICIGETLNFSINAAKADSIFLFPGNGDVIRIPVPFADTLAPFFLSYTFDLPGAYLPQVVLADTTDCLTVLTTDSVWVGEPPITSIWSDLTTACQGVNFQFQDQTLPFDSLSTASWYVEDTVINTASSDTLLYAFTDVGTQTVTVIVETAFGCYDTANLLVEILPLPPIDLPVDTISCPGLGVELMAGGGISYSWSPPDGLSATDIPNPIADPDSSTLYTVAVDDGTCVDSAQVFVEVLDSLLEDWGWDTTICIGGTVPLYAQLLPDLPPEVLYGWNPITGIEDPASLITFATPPGVGTWNYQIDVSCGLLVSSETVTVQVNAPPDVNITQGDTTIFPGENVVLPTEILSGGTGFSTFTWSPPSGLSCVVCPTTDASPQQSITYQVMAVDELGCVDSSEVRIDVRADCGEGVFNLPNLISPNGDGANDVLRFEYDGISEIYQIRVFDRWGDLMFESNDELIQWDGTCRGKPCTPGVYVYTIDALCENGVRANIPADVTLIR